MIIVDFVIVNPLAKYILLLGKISLRCLLNVFLEWCRYISRIFITKFTSFTLSIRSSLTVLFIIIFLNIKSLDFFTKFFFIFFFKVLRDRRQRNTRSTNKISRSIFGERVGFKKQRYRLRLFNTLDRKDSINWSLSLFL